MIEKNKPSELELLRDYCRRQAQRKFDKLIIEREDAELRKQFCVSGELLLHPTDQQCKDNPSLVVYSYHHDISDIKRALMIPPDNRLKAGDLYACGKVEKRNTVISARKAAHDVLEDLIKQGNMSMEQLDTLLAVMTTSPLEDSTRDFTIFLP